MNARERFRLAYRAARAGRRYGDCEFSWTTAFHAPFWVDQRVLTEKARSRNSSESGGRVWHAAVAVQPWRNAGRFAPGSAGPRVPRVAGFLPSLAERGGDRPFDLGALVRALSNGRSSSQRDYLINTAANTILLYAGSNVSNSRASRLWRLLPSNGRKWDVFRMLLGPVGSFGRIPQVADDPWAGLVVTGTTACDHGGRPLRVGVIGPLREPRADRAAGGYPATDTNREHGPA